MILDFVAQEQSVRALIAPDISDFVSEQNIVL